MEKHLTHTKWIVWYHNPSDKNWSLESYKDIIEISSIEDFCVLKNTWKKCLPNINEGMFFVMRKTEEGCIYPRWEDKHNRRGGYWSFKISKEDCEGAWFSLMMFTLGEYLVRRESDISLINGISISPKKHFCILKIWTCDSTRNSKSLLSNDLTFLDMENVLFSNHEDNIQKDYDKVKRRQSHHSTGTGGGSTHRHQHKYSRNSRNHGHGSNRRGRGRHEQYEERGNRRNRYNNL